MDLRKTMHANGLLTIFQEEYIFISIPGKLSEVHLHAWQYVANIRIFEYIRIFIDKYIHSLKYSWIFPKRIYSDIHSRLFSPHEYIRTFIGNVRFQQIHWFEAERK